MKSRAVNRRIRSVIKFFNELEKLVIGNLSFIVLKTEFTVNEDFLLRAFAGSEELIDRYLADIVKSGITEAELFETLSFESVSGPAPANLEALAKIEGLQHIRETTSISRIPLATTKKQFGTVFTAFNNLPDNKRNFPELINMVKDRFKEISFSRARTIATTEMNNLANFASVQGAFHGGATHKQWVWSGVEREAHAEIDGQTVIIDGNFTTGNGNSGPFPNGIGAPEDDINCTCDMIFMTLTAEEALEV
ncbi:MAG: hypothetical protein QQN63_01465 [Nitrosopumilus sp.]